MTQYIEIPVLKPRMMQFTVLTFFEGCFVGGFTIFGHFRHTVYHDSTFRYSLEVISHRTLEK